MRGEVQILVSVSIFSIHRRADGTIWSSTQEYIKEGKTTIRFKLHSKLDSFFNPIEVMKQVLDSLLWDNSTDVINISLPKREFCEEVFVLHGLADLES